MNVILLPDRYAHPWLLRIIPGCYTVVIPGCYTHPWLLYDIPGCYTPP